MDRKSVFKHSFSTQQFFVQSKKRKKKENEKKKEKNYVISFLRLKKEYNLNILLMNNIINIIINIILYITIEESCC